MSSRKFTKEEMGVFKTNQYTHAVSANTIYFTIQFKKDFWKRMQQGMDTASIVTELGYDPDMLGSTRISGLRQIIKKQALDDCVKQSLANSQFVFFMIFSIFFCTLISPCKRFLLYANAFLSAFIEAV